jgi:hypothetical protein
MTQVYECKPCCYKTDRSHNLTIHKNSKKHLKRILEQKAENESSESENDEHVKAPTKVNGKVCCERCGKHFTEKTNLYRHMRIYCKVNKKYDNIPVTELKHELEILQKAYNKLKEEYDELDRQNRRLVEENTDLLKKIPNKKTPIPKTLKQAVWNKHIGEKNGKGLCKCCNLRTISQMHFHCGHIKAESKGGATHIDNLLPICAICNGSIYNKDLNDVKKMFETKDNLNKIVDKYSEKTSCKQSKFKKQ